MGNFQITAKGSYENAQKFEQLVISWGVPSGAKKGLPINIARDTSNPDLWYAIANEVPSDFLRQKKEELRKFWMGNSNITLQIAAQHQDHCLDFADAPFDKLGEFLKKPKNLIFPPFEILPDGCTRCFQNALDLTTSAENLLKQQNILRHHVAFFLLTALEEFGKGLLILKHGKADIKAGKKAVAMSFFRSHCEKFEEMSKQLAGEQQVLGDIRGRKKGAWDYLVEHLQASGRPGALRLSDPEILVILSRMKDPKELYPDNQKNSIKRIRHPGETYREQTLYVEYVGRSKEWADPQIQWSERDLGILAKHLKMYCEIMIKEINAKDRIDKIRDLQEVLISPDFILPSDRSNEEIYS